MRFIGATETLRRVTRMASPSIATAAAISADQSCRCSELENMAGVMLWSETETYARYIEKHGMPSAAPPIAAAAFATDDGVHGSFRAAPICGQPL